MKIIYYFLLFHPSLYFYLYRIIHRKRGAMKIDDKKYQQEKTKISNNLLVPLLIPALLTTIMELESIIIEKLDPNDLMGVRGNGEDAAPSIRASFYFSGK